MAAPDSKHSDAKDEQLRASVAPQLQRQRQHKPAGPLGLVLTGGTLGLLLVVPLLIGAYLGRWLDAHLAGYAMHWTLSLLLLGLFIGIYNAYRFLKRWWK